MDLVRFLLVNLLDWKFEFVGLSLSYFQNSETFLLHVHFLGHFQFVTSKFVSRLFVEIVRFSIAGSDCLNIVSIGSEAPRFLSKLIYYSHQYADQLSMLHLMFHTRSLCFSTDLIYSRTSSIEMFYQTSMTFHLHFY